MGGTEEKIELKLKFLDFCAKGLIRVLAGGNERELKRKEKIIQEGIDEVHALKYVGLKENITEGLNEDVIELW